MQKGTRGFALESRGEFQYNSQRATILRWTTAAGDRVVWPDDRVSSTEAIGRGARRTGSMEHFASFRRPVHLDHTVLDIDLMF